MGTRHRGGTGKRLARISLLLGLVAAVALWSGASTAHAAPAATTTISTCDEATLDSAIANAASGDTISFGCGADIKLTQTLTISKNLTLDGSGQSVTLDGNNSTQVLSVNSGVSLTLNALTISHGNSSADGGGVYNNGGTVTISNSTFANDVTSDFDGGGGVYNNGGTVTISNSTFANNQAVGHNGGGGLLNDAGTVTISNSTFANNQASFGNGGGIRNIGTLTISNSTFAGNTSGAPGGGLEVHSGTVSISNSTFAGNSSGGFVMFDGTGTIGNSIFANNSWHNCLDLSDQVISSAGYNVDSGTDCGFTGAGDLQNTDPKLAPLANYGGPTQTMALLSGSPAIDKIPAANCPATDQRGVTRPQGSACDIGAVEYHAPTLSLPRSPITAKSTSPTGTATITYSATASGPSDLSGTPSVRCTPASGSAFPVGTTTVTCSASQPGSDTATGSFQVVVTDGTAPTLILPSSPVTANATDSTGAVVAYTVKATDPDNATGDLTTSCTPTSGGTFPIGTTTVNCSASDPSGNSNSGSFSVVVIGAAGQVANLQSQVDSFRLASGPQTSFDGQLNAVQADLAAGNSGQACSDLASFSSHVKAQSGKQLTADQASSLLAAAARIQSVIGC